MECLVMMTTKNNISVLCRYILTISRYPRRSSLCCTSSVRKLGRLWILSYVILTRTKVPHPTDLAWRRERPESIGLCLSHQFPYCCCCCCCCWDFSQSEEKETLLSFLQQQQQSTGSNSIFSLSRSVSWRKFISLAGSVASSSLQKLKVFNW